LIGIITAGLMVNLAPSLAYQHKHGKNPDAVKRLASEAEAFGLKLAPLLLPVQSHRVDALAKITSQYQHPLGWALLHNENLYGPLGMTGACGFLILLGALLLPPGLSEGWRNIWPLAVLNVFGVFLGTMGGLGALLATAGINTIRAYNRVSIYIAFLALTAVGLVLTSIDRRATTRLVRPLYRILLLVLLGVAIVDQTTTQFVPPYEAIKLEEEQLERFVRNIEQSVPSGTMVFQLPWVPFLEHQPPCAMYHYDHLKGYLHSSSLRWSYGAMPGRRADYFQRHAVEHGPEAMLRMLSLAGFGGVWLDRNGYADRGTAVMADLDRTLKVRPLESENGRWLFFNMESFNGESRKTLTDQEWQSAHEAITHPIVPMWTGGFCSEEGQMPHCWRCCSETGRIELDNDLPRPRKCAITMTCQTWQAKPAHLHVRGLGLDQIEAVTSAPRTLSLVCSVPPGRHAIKLCCDAERAKVPTDPRALVFLIADFSLKEE
jgi:phosphoglycerol transferase